jgi:hypothetical protein
MTGRRNGVLRLLSAAAVLAILASGCGGAARPERAASGIPRALAQGWEDRADAIAAEASAGNVCGARQLAISLRDDVSRAHDKVPLRLRGPLLTSVNSLADRTTCAPAATNTTPPAQSQPSHKGPKPPKKHWHHGHDKGDAKGHDG